MGGCFGGYQSYISSNFVVGFTYTFSFSRSTLLSLRPSNHQPSPSIATTSHSTPPPQTPSLPPTTPTKTTQLPTPPPHPTSSQKPPTPTHTPHTHSKPTTDASLDGKTKKFKWVCYREVVTMRVHFPGGRNLRFILLLIVVAGFVCLFVCLFGSGGGGGGGWV